MEGAFGQKTNMHEDRSETKRKCAQVAKPRWGTGEYLACGGKCTVTCPSGKSLAKPFMGYLVLQTRAPRVLALLAYPNPTGLLYGLWEYVIGPCVIS